MTFRRTWTRLAVFLAVAVTVVLVAAAHRWATQYFLDETARQGRAELDLHRELVRGWLGRYQALAPVYARDPAVIDALDQPGEAAKIDLLNRKLVAWTALSGALDTYVLDPGGTAIAASNWADPVSFVGNNYSFRPYYRQAMNGRLGRFFALGTSSGKRGYYFSHPVRSGGEIIGVVVVKIGVDRIEQDLRSRADEVFVSDTSGVIVLSGNPAWRLKTLGPLTEADRTRIKTNRQYNPGTLTPVAITGMTRTAPPENGALVRARPDLPDARKQEFLHVAEPMAAEGWTIHLLVDTAPARAQALTAAALVAALILAAGLAAAVFLEHRRRLVDRLTERARNEALLEQKVAERTAELSEANLRLGREVTERTAAEEELRRTQADLVQAGKLAALGQMSAALSHEFNQPLTAVRTYAENALAFLDRGRTAQAADNVSRISTLTQRMAQLSRHLTSFARKPQRGMGPIRLNAVFDEVLGLLQGRLERAGITPELSGLDDEVAVIGGMVRLQHVFMNLIGNAIDALAGQADPRIMIGVTVDGETVTVTVEDNGPGIAEGDLGKVFDPFFTTKDVGKGLGLGLSISYNIIGDFGGTIRAANRAQGGACFTVILRRAEQVPAEAAE